MLDFFQSIDPILVSRSELGRQLACENFLFPENQCFPAPVNFKVSSSFSILF